MIKSAVTTPEASSLTRLGPIIPDQLKPARYTSQHINQFSKETKHDAFRILMAHLHAPPGPPVRPSVGESTSVRLSVCHLSLSIYVRDLKTSVECADYRFRHVHPRLIFTWVEKVRFRIVMVFGVRTS